MTDFLARTRRSTVTLLVRVVTDSGTDGFAGHAEVVDTGEVVPIRGVADLEALIQRLTGLRD